MNLKEKKDISKLMFLFEDPDAQIKRLQQSLKFQKKHQSQYIAFLENKVKSLLNENSNLRRSINVMNGNINNNEKNNSNNLNNGKNCSINDSLNSNSSNVKYEMDKYSTICSTPNITKMNANMKKIEIKQSNENYNSSRYTPYINRYNENLNNVKNLNRQTVLEHSNKQNSNINVNINNNNSNRRSSPYISNFSNRNSSSHNVY